MTTTPVAAAATPSGKVTASAWAELSDVLLGALNTPVDGILLALHGAMVTETTDDAEGELLARIRARYGEAVPIVVTLDLHANVTDRMAALANALIAYRSYPHVDMYERGQQAADLLARAMTGKIRPRCVVARRPTLDGVDHGRTTKPGPMLDALKLAQSYDGESGLLAVSIQAGFPWADILEAGPSVAVTGDGESNRFRSIADAIMDLVWRTRAATTLELVSLDDAITIARQADDSGRPLVLADFTDNPGGGGYGDATKLLGRMIQADLQNAAFVPITDPDAVYQCQTAGVGAKLTLDIGGKMDPDFGAPLKVMGTVERLGSGEFVADGPMWKGLRMSMGACAVLSVGGLEIVLASNRFQITDLQQFVSLGIDPLKKAVIGVKSAHHFRAAYQPIARKVLTVDAGGLTTPDFRRFAYHKVRRPIWPLDAIGREHEGLP